MLYMVVLSGCETDLAFKRNFENVWTQERESNMKMDGEGGGMFKSKRMVLVAL
jgi:hypothetical protein